MAEGIAELTRVVEAMRQPLTDYARLIQDIASSNAVALTLYGRVVSPTFDPARHTARSVMIMGQVDLAALRRLALHGAKLGKSAIAAPLVMTPDYIKASLDTFPLEFIEIGQHHLTLFGEDHFADLSFEDTHVRLQCERELKTVLIGLRQGLLAAAGREKFISALEQDVAEALMRTMRGMLWLKGMRDALPGDKVVEEIEKLTERKLPGVRTAMDPEADHGWEAFEKLYRDVESLGEIANGW